MRLVHRLDSRVRFLDFNRASQGVSDWLRPKEASCLLLTGGKFSNHKLMRSQPISIGLSRATRAEWESKFNHLYGSDLVKLIRTLRMRPGREL